MTINFLVHKLFRVLALRSHETLEIKAAVIAAEL